MESGRTERALNMNTLERTLIEKADYAHGWKNVRESTPERVVLPQSRGPYQTGGHGHELAGDLPQRPTDHRTCPQPSGTPGRR